VAEPAVAPPAGSAPTVAFDDDLARPFGATGAAPRPPRVPPLPVGSAGPPPPAGAGAPPVGARLTDRGAEVLLSLYQHRLMATRQVHRLHNPGRTVRATQMLLRRLRLAGLADCVRRDAHSEALWYVTPTGADVAELGEVRTRGYRITPAAVRLLAHTLAVNEVGVAFAAAARAHGHECGPLDWEHEMPHPWRDPPRGFTRGTDHLVLPDAVLRYTVVDDDADLQLTRFVEVDRATATVATVETKVRAYAALHDYRPPGSARPGWRDRYVQFPKLLIVLAGKPEPVLARRRDSLIAACRTNPDIAARAAVLGTAITTLAELVEHGPFAPICWPVFGADEPRDVIAAAAPPQA
jgi:hypothetical protein